MMISRAKAVLLLLGCATLPATVMAAEADLAPIFAGFTQETAPGCAVGWETAGGESGRRARGSADLEHHTPITADTIFEAGSVSKQFTAAAVLILAEQGRLSLNDQIRRYLPELNAVQGAITVDQLLTHTSGLRDWGAVARLGGWPRGTRAYDNNDVLKITARQRALNYVPGTDWSYTNTDFSLLAIIVERVSGQSLAQFSREHIFVPLVLKDTNWRDDFRNIVPGRAIAYEQRAGAWSQSMPFENAYGAGGMLTTVDDLLRWNRALSTTLAEVLRRARR
jgi:CubicO group peptidase (beta-lactamase class C family)